MSRERPDAGRTYRMLATEPLEYAPGTRHHYTSNSWFVLGELIRRLDGRPYPVFLRQEVLEHRPARFNDTNGNPRDRKIVSKNRKATDNCNNQTVA